MGNSPELTLLIWERPEPAGRPAPTPLTRELILQAAMALADDEGLASVSLRKVGGALKAGPMRLYGYIATKEELLDLMVDDVYREIVANGMPDGDWRVSLRLLCRRMREAALRHRWFVELIGGRPHLGPSALTFMEHALTAMDGAKVEADSTDVFAAVQAVHAYVIGAIRTEIAEMVAERESGISKAKWQATMAAYMARAVSTGRFPVLARMVEQAAQSGPEAAFERGLDWLFDGIAAQTH